MLALLPSHFSPQTWHNATALPSLTGAWAPNAALAGAELQDWNGTALAPECIAEDAAGAVYASVAFGAVLRAPAHPSQPGTPVFFTPAAAAGWTGQLAAHPLYAWCLQQALAKNASAEEVCGRPLGLRLKGSRLYVADAYFGIFAADLSDSSAPPAWLVRPEDASPPMRFFNDLDVAADGTVYFTDSSSVHTRRENRLEVLNNARLARLLRKAPDAPLETLARGHFLNGVQLLPDESAVVVVELGRLRLLRCSLPLPAGQQCVPEVFAAGLPGVPDNVRLSADGRSLLVGCATRVAQPFSLLHLLWTRARGARVAGVLLSRLPLHAALELAERAVPRRGLVLRLALDGTPLGSLHDTSGRVALLSHVHEARDRALWLGSASNPFIARVPPPA